MKKESQASLWDLKFQKKRKSNTKNGAELTEKVNVMNFEVQEEECDIFDTTAIKLDVEQRANELLEIALKKKIRVKAKAGLIENVNLMNVELEENFEKNFSETLLKVQLENSEKEMLEIALKKKIKFKAGAELTDKVNKVAVDWIEELIDGKEILTVSLKITSTISQNQIVDVHAPFK